jgi:hypothetical protein
VSKDVVERHHDVDELVAAGESEWTPWIVIGRVWIVTALVVLVLIAVVLFAYRVA